MLNQNLVYKKNTKFKWYVISIHSGSEYQVKKNLIIHIEKRKLGKYFNHIIIPIEIIEKKSLKKRILITKKCFPGYMLINLNLNEKVLTLIKQTPKIIGFVGNNFLPTSLNNKEIKNIYSIMKKMNNNHSTLYKIGSFIKINRGPLMNLNGVIKYVNFEKEKIKVLVSILGRMTPIELNFSDVDKLD